MILILVKISSLLSISVNHVWTHLANQYIPSVIINFSSAFPYVQK